VNVLLLFKHFPVDSTNSLIRKTLSLSEYRQMADAPLRASISMDNTG